MVIPLPAQILGLLILFFPLVVGLGVLKLIILNKKVLVFALPVVDEVVVHINVSKGFLELSLNDKVLLFPFVALLLQFFNLDSQLVNSQFIFFIVFLCVMEFFLNMDVFSFPLFAVLLLGLILALPVVDEVTVPIKVLKGFLEFNLNASVLLFQFVAFLLPVVGSRVIVIILLKFDYGKFELIAANLNLLDFNSDFGVFVFPLAAVVLCFLELLFELVAFVFPPFALLGEVDVIHDSVWTYGLHQRLLYLVLEEGEYHTAYGRLFIATTILFIFLLLWVIRC